MIDVECLVKGVGGATDSDCCAALAAYVKVTSVMSRSGRLSEARKADIAFAVLEIAEHRAPRDEQGQINARLLAIDAMRLIVQRLTVQVRAELH